MKTIDMNNRKEVMEYLFNNIEYVNKFPELKHSMRLIGSFYSNRLESLPSRWVSMIIDHKKKERVGYIWLIVSCVIMAIVFIGGPIAMYVKGEMSSFDNIMTFYGCMSFAYLLSELMTRFVPWSYRSLRDVIGDDTWYGFIACGLLFVVALVVMLGTPAAILISVCSSEALADLHEFVILGVLMAYALMFRIIFDDDDQKK